jgi:hypothetical protein
MLRQAPDDDTVVKIIQEVLPKVERTLQLPPAEGEEP